MNNIVLILIVLISLLGIKYLWSKYQNNKLKIDIWKKDYEKASDISSYSIAQLIKQANERRRNSRDKKN